MEGHNLGLGLPHVVGAIRHEGSDAKLSHLYTRECKQPRKEKLVEESLPSMPLLERDSPYPVPAALKEQDLASEQAGEPLFNMYNSS